MSDWHLLRAVTSHSRPRRFSSSGSIPIGRLLVYGAVNLGRRVPENTSIDDAVPPIDRLRLVPYHRHRSGPRHTGALEIPDRRPPEVVKDAARHAGGSTCRSPRWILPRARRSLPVRLDNRGVEVLPRVAVDAVV